MSSLYRWRWLLPFAMGAALTACPGNPKSAVRAGASGESLGSSFASAVEAEQTASGPDAARAFADLLALGAAAREEAWSRAATFAAVDSLLERRLPGFENQRVRSALAHRIDFDERPALERAWQNATHASSRIILADALAHAWEERGEPSEAEAWRSRTGCARDAIVAGPIDGQPLIALGEPPSDPRALPRATFASPAALGRPIPTASVSGFGCAIPLDAASARGGLREVVVDVDVRAPSSLTIAIRSSVAARVFVGRSALAVRPHEWGSGDAWAFGRVHVDAGRARFVVRAAGESGSLAFYAASDDPDPKEQPRIVHPAQEHAPSGHRDAHALGWPSPSSWQTRALVAAGAMGAGDLRTAERVAQVTIGKGPGADALRLVAARVSDAAVDLTPEVRAERSRDAYQRAARSWPTAWEPVLGAIALEGERKGPGSSSTAILTKLDDLRDKGKLGPAGKRPNAAIELLDAYAAGKAGLTERSRASLRRARGAEKATTRTWADVERQSTPRSRAQTRIVSCDGTHHPDRSSLDCFHALVAEGQPREALTELEGLRARLGAPLAFGALEVQLLSALGSLDRAKAAFERMLPGERTIGLRLGLVDLDAIGKPERARLARDIESMAVIARDVPMALASALDGLEQGVDEPQAKTIRTTIDARRERPLGGTSGTTILLRNERYALAATGLMRVDVVDVRELAGTTDIEENAAASLPTITGRGSFRVVRRRIHKRDGRVLDPDHTPGAAQSHAELAQLERGDIVEAIYQGWVVPEDDGAIGVDGTDLLPERTSLEHATIRVEAPSSLRLGVWAHPLLGKAEETSSGDKRVWVWTPKALAPRRIEPGAPPMDARVRVNFSSQTWAEIARSIRNAAASMHDTSIDVDRWIEHELGQAAASKTPCVPAKTLERLVDAAGETIREPSAFALSDVGGAFVSASYSSSARQMIAEHAGSRTWLVWRALRRLGARARLLVAEEHAFSASPNFPAQTGRFSHPVLAVDVCGQGGEATEVRWVDADVTGPPLPPGHMTPALAGRRAIDLRGAIQDVPSAKSDDDDTDQIDVRLRVDDAGNASGSVTLLLRGRAAQALAEHFERSVGIERQRTLESIVLGWLPTADIERVALSSSEGSWQIAVRADVRLPAFVESKQGGSSSKRWRVPGIDAVHEVFPRPYSTTLGATFGGLEGRESAFGVNLAVRYHIRRRIELPLGIKAAEAPSPFLLSHPGLSANRRTRVSDNVLEEDASLRLDAQTISAKNYAEFEHRLRQIDAAFAATAVFDAPAQASPPSGAAPRGEKSSDLK